MKCNICNEGDLHYSNFKFNFKFPNFWKIKIIEREFVCDNCGNNIWKKPKEEFVKSSEKDITKSMPNMYAIREKNLMEFFKNADEKTRKKMIKEGLVKENKRRKIKDREKGGRKRR